MIQREIREITQTCRHTDIVAILFSAMKTCDSNVIVFPETTKMLVDQVIVPLSLVSLTPKEWLEWRLQLDTALFHYCY